MISWRSFVRLLASLFISLLPVLAWAQEYQSHALHKDGLEVKLKQGTLTIAPLDIGTIRIKMEGQPVTEERELILVNKLPVPSFTLKETPSELHLMTEAVTVSLNKVNGALEFADHNGIVFLKEKPGSRKLKQDSLRGESCFVAEQTFDSPEDEYLFGLGQFQDGHFNLKSVTRKLVQVNSQIAIPMVQSSRGYGILWHQYGLTEFNPADNFIALSERAADSPENKEVEVTTTAGTQKVSQRQSLHTGKFSIDKDGLYSIMLDLGDMDSRHLVVIDGAAIIDQSNLWLPPTVSKLVRLTKGEHTVQVVSSTKNKPSLSWKLVDNTTTFRSPHAKSLDYVVFHGKNADSIISSYRNLSGHAPLLPLWSYGFWQCRERYTSARHLVETVTEFRKRRLPMDVIVQDWQYWGNNGWGVPKLDETNYPNPSSFIREIHDLNAHFAISIWSNPDKQSQLGQMYSDKGLFIQGTKWLDYFHPETRNRYWNTLNENLFRHGVDAWWMDATEPENDALKGTKTYFGLGEFYRLTYPMLVSQSVYEGQRASGSNKRVCILTRSAFPGQQRYGVINWSGDVGWDWDAYRRQIVAGLNFTITGLPYWTTDIGGFFRPGPSQYTDEKYHELLTRWFQWGTFCTIFRIHGYQTETEPWKYGEIVEENMRSMMELRYRLIPYIYSEAWKISSSGSTMMRPLIMDFRHDKEAISQSYEYMFGKSFLVSPVVEPGVSQANVYLPKGASWYNFWNGKFSAGGQTVTVDTPLDQLPLFVRAGSILPMTDVVQSTNELSMDTLEVRIYTGADGQFDLYLDEGDNYQYENGHYKIIPFKWNDKKKTLIIDKAVGKYAMKGRHIFNLVWYGEDAKSANTPAQRERVQYVGERISIVKK